MIFCAADGVTQAVLLVLPDKMDTHFRGKRVDEGELRFLAFFPELGFQFEVAGEVFFNSPLTPAYYHEDVVYA